MPDRKSPIDQALDVLFFAPLGLALSAKEELPKLAEKGRQRLSNHVTVARMVGQFAVTTGQKEAEKAAGRVADRLGALPGAPETTAGAAQPREAAPPATPPAPVVATGNGAPHNGAGGSVAGGSGAGAGGVGAGGSVGGLGAGAPPADHLAIPGYDSLSASQVVQRLGGLSDPELDAVREYEEATRSRRTILAKVAQLQHERA